MLNKDEIKQLMKMVACQKIGAKEALTYYHSGILPSEEEEMRVSYLPNVSSHYKIGDIAVVGISGKFPDADNVNEFWDNLVSGKDSTRELSKKRYDIYRHYSPNRNIPNKSISKWGGQLSDINKFDPAFFNISPTQAKYMDPRQRLFLEETYKALEDACMSDRYLGGKKCSVYVGCVGSTDYLYNTNVELNAEFFLGYSNAILASRISYFLDLKGASITIDTGCSSSLVCIHMACESLRSGESEIAIAGGVQILNRPDTYIALSKADMLSPTGKCRAFDAKADGMVPGEAVSVVVLKRLQDAISDGDNIYGVIVGTGMNQDGRTNGITSPNAISQAQLQCDVYDRFNIDPARITYIESHGTGTPLGDIIEIEALQNSFRKYTKKVNYCAISSVKPNVGHSFGASGVVNLIKVLLAIKYEKIPPSLNYNRPSNGINLEGSPFFVNTSLTQWEGLIGIPRMAAINSFGHSGTNCHIVVREHVPSEIRRVQSLPAYMVVLSAKTKEALYKKVIGLRAWLENEGDSHSIEDIVYSMLAGNSFFQYRYAFIVKNKFKLEMAFKTILEGGLESFDCVLARKVAPNEKQYGKMLLEELSNGNMLEDEEYEEKLEELSRLFMQGYDIPYDDLYKDRGYKCIPLIKYPFARESYWISEEVYVGNEIEG